MTVRRPPFVRPGRRVADQRRETGAFAVHLRGAARHPVPGRRRWKLELGRSQQGAVPKGANGTGPVRIQGSWSREQGSLVVQVAVAASASSPNPRRVALLGVVGLRSRPGLRGRRQSVAALRRYPLPVVVPADRRGRPPYSGLQEFLAVFGNFNVGRWSEALGRPARRRPRPKPS